MVQIHLQRGRSLALILAGVLLGATVGVVSGAIPTGDVFYACYDSAGKVRFIDFETTQTCPKGHTGPVSWNQTGPQGEQGIQGEQGEPGAAASQVVFFATGSGTANPGVPGPSGGGASVFHLSVTVPAGSYVVQADIAASGAANDVTCTLPGDAATVHEKLHYHDVATGLIAWADLGLTSALTTSGGSIGITCEPAFNPIGGADTDITATLLATKVDSVN